MYNKHTQPAFCRLSFFKPAVIFLFALAAACERSPEPSFHVAEQSPGGDTSVSNTPFPAYDKPVANLPETLKADFYAGKALAEQPWIKAPTTTDARDGLGPLYNARTCMACHIRGGRGRIPTNPETLLVQGVVRLSVNADADKALGVAPHPAYGDQFQSQSISLAHQLRHSHGGELEHSVAPEAYIFMKWQRRSFEYPDGGKAELVKPIPQFNNPAYGPLTDGLQTSLRNAPAIHGVGLLEQISDADIAAFADPQDKNGDGISGRVNRVWDPLSQQYRPGRFGWKANRSNLPVTVAAAFVNDVGITSPLFPDQPCTEKQHRCLQMPTGNDATGVELPAHLLDLVVLFTRNLGVPLARLQDTKNLQRGRALFYQTGCQHCHRPSYQTSGGAHDHLAAQTIWPYSDLLVHDMGPALADGRPDFEASGSEWRTPPLWGLGLSRQVNGSFQLLHDGRARTVEEAILWHGGEAEIARQRFITLPAAARQKLIKFVEAL